MDNPSNPSVFNQTLPDLALADAEVTYEKDRFSVGYHVGCCYSGRSGHCVFARRSQPTRHIAGLRQRAFRISVEPECYSASAISRLTATPARLKPTRTARIGEVIFLRPRDIERLEVDGRSLEEARYQTHTIDVALGPNWIDTGVDVRRGERVRIDATGTIYAGRTRITPAGLSTSDPSAPLPRAGEGQLIGVIGNDSEAPIIEIGAGREFSADRDGRLYLTINRGSYTDARGAYNVRIRREFDLTAMGRTTTDDRSDDFDPFGLPGESTGPAPTRIRRRGDFPTNDRRTDRMLERTINVPGTESRGVDTGIDLRAGDQVRISASGSITAGQRVGAVRPDGARAGASSIFGVSRRPVPNAGVGALIGYLMQPGGGTVSAVHGG